MVYLCNFLSNLKFVIDKMLFLKEIFITIIFTVVTINNKIFNLFYKNEFII